MKTNPNTPGMLPEMCVLTCLGEEGSEISQAVSKILRFGLLDSHPLRGHKTTSQCLAEELNDLRGVLKELEVEFGIRFPEDDKRIEAKRRKVRKFMWLSMHLGQVRHPEVDPLRGIEIDHELGLHMTADRFVSACLDNKLTDDDGVGLWATATHMNPTAIASPSKVTKRGDWATHVVWFKK